MAGQVGPKKKVQISKPVGTPELPPGYTEEVEDATSHERLRELLNEMVFEGPLEPGQFGKADITFKTGMEIFVYKCLTCKRAFKSDMHLDKHIRETENHE